MKAMKAMILIGFLAAGIGWGFGEAGKLCIHNLSVIVSICGFGWIAICSIAGKIADYLKDD